MSYSGSDITVLEGLEPVRLRPGMYIGGTGKDGLHHLLWETVDNSVDEAINGFATKIKVTLHEDGQSVTVSDNGRGIPVDEHPTEKRSTLEVIFTKLHAGGKFNQNNYRTSGGLHGVGASVVNALSSELVVQVRRHGKVHEQRFVRGRPLGPVEVVGSHRSAGTTIFFRPDDEIFDDLSFDGERIAEWLEAKAYLIQGLHIVFKDEVNKTKHDLRFEGGLLDMLGSMIEQKDTERVHAEPFRTQIKDEEHRYELEVGLSWTESTKDRTRSFVNAIPTADGGTHELGMRDAIIKALRTYFDTYDLLPNKLNVSSDDMREGLFAAVSLFMPEPQFQGQTKDKLNNPEVRSWVAASLRIEFERFLNQNPTIGQAIGARVVQAARARAASRSASESSRKKRPRSNRLNLPGKLADCSSSDPERCELFIVEGDSAGGSAKQGRDRRTQAILPLRGKVLNAEQATHAKVMKNKELSDIVSALGCGMGDGIDASKLRYHKIIFLMDADSDGHHISTLLLTFFYRYLRPLIDRGHVYLAQPPLYRVDIGKKTFWALDERHKSRILRRKRRGEVRITRFKGLGEMMPKTLFETTLDPDNRRLLRVSIDADERLVTEKVISELMGRDAAPRFDFIMNNAEEVDELDL